VARALFCGHIEVHSSLGAAELAIWSAREKYENCELVGSAAITKSGVQGGWDIAIIPVAWGDVCHGLGTNPSSELSATG
jgi:hypothetical protein